MNGLTAKALLQHCLLIHVHLMDDWDTRLEYTRTMAVARCSGHRGTQLFLEQCTLRRRARHCWGGW